MLLDVVYGPQAAANLIRFARQAETPELRELLSPVGGFTPPLTYASDFAFRPAGAALTYGLASEQRLLTAGAVTYARQFIALTVAAADHASYLGNWILAAGATGIEGLAVHEYLQRGRPSTRPDSPIYLRATTASYAELIRQPGTVTDRLIGRLLWASADGGLPGGRPADHGSRAMITIPRNEVRGRAAHRRVKRPARRPAARADCRIWLKIVASDFGSS